MKDISNNIKKVLLVFLICFMGLITYITYFEIVVGPKIVDSSYNRRLWVKRNEVLRGTIYDRNMQPLTKSQRVNSELQNREYTGSSMFAHVLGYVNVKYGLTGLEKKYDKELMSTDIQDDLTTFFKNKGKLEQKVGHNLKTTLDYKIQKAAYDALGENKGAVVVLNPKTGEVLGMVSKPSYDPNKLDDIWASINKDKSIPLINRATAGLYPPGSTFKIVTALSTLENMSGVMNRTFQDNGSLDLGGGYTLSNYGGASYGGLDLRGAFVHSSNVIFGSLGLELGNSRLKSTAEKFYFNKEVPTDGIAIESSKFPTLKSYERGSIAQSGIGQSSILVTPMEMALIGATVANDGVMMKPYLVKEVLSSKGELIRTIPPESNGEIVSKNNARILKDFMKGVVEEGSGRNASIEGIQVAGKTGTADHSDSISGKAAAHSWFVGFAPYDNPQVAVAIIVENGGQGGIAAASIASQVMSTALSK
ncbi:peptidoglycan D,D-transpeptidase FtsI family protein [Clostridium sp. FAM 1755]|jgi:cell division protein FtsI/penicillin-binding protein 2|uniref:Beta-lactamase n=1 Tax=Clostridium botulinum TaxID=1491 RepID=A0A6M0SZ10_CLOBO|nr:penicillin-binding protein 2 [Clostridium sporogenes]NFA59161.1 penicillin-binding protein 2 [Clostridium botulinum]NFI74768.1 penicillin-binding protein 2 [Clostridium sporogenes]NFL71099.1 penicillin-binding protein 2 [Clostridium sporogenes]NFM24509.1 penicillin-binding protein 2 [Clostridium sporogenes]NFN86172.1 penicillin-binding protein 2 [Clostridium sporogenes]